jgi:hypothetical protein
MKRNGIARPNWTFIFVHFSKMPGKVCKDPLSKTHCYHCALFSDFFLKTMAAKLFNIYYAENDLGEKLYSI